MAKAKAILIVMTIVVGVMFLAFVLPNGCTRPDVAMRVLSENGYTNIEITGYRFFMCGEGDQFATGFTATSPNGTFVSGCVCSGWMKGATIRFD